jgi:uncharacterized protein (DUF1778 family)
LFTAKRTDIFCFSKEQSLFLRSAATAASTVSSRARTERLNLRTTADEDALIRAAAEIQEKSVSQFVLDAAKVAAQNAILDQRSFRLSEADWNALMETLDRPAVFKPKLAALMKLAPTDLTA